VRTGRWFGILQPIDVDRERSDIRVVAPTDVRIDGRITGEQGPLTFDPRGLRIQVVTHQGAQPNQTSLMMVLSRGNAVNADGTFSIDRVVGLTTLNVSELPAEWTVKAIRLDGEDVTEQPTDFADSARRQVEIVLTNRMSTVVGRVADTRGRPVSNYTVVVFPANRDRWVFPSHVVQAVRSKNDGSYDIHGLPAGSYLAAALESLPMNAWNDPDVLELLRGSSAAFQIGDGDQKALNLRLSATPYRVRQP
jgi:hypothetical protein